MTAAPHCFTLEGKMCFGGENYFAIFPSALQSDPCLFLHAEKEFILLLLVQVKIRISPEQLKEVEFGLIWKDKYLSLLMLVLGIHTSLT